MGDSFGDIFYIIAMVGALVFSIIRKTRGTKQDGTSVPQSEYTEVPQEAFPTLSDWFDTPEPSPEEVKEEKPITIPTSSMQPEVMRPPKMVYNSSGYQRIKSRDNRKRPERVSRISSKIVSKNLVKEDDDSQTIASTGFDDEPIDLRKAIVYTEILKRPVF
ncbi:hypothetical protein ACT3CD_01815 [Geofilum sp. OHC36d9]|uniref:hypothetical protein n=1 Tax=Geofilum sp. OHC36d9 TaxID=3458413 RepID=UPI004034D450